MVAIGSPLGLPDTVTQGIVVGPEPAGRRPVRRATPTRRSPTSTGSRPTRAINPGNSGGPLVDAGARVIGVNSAILTFGDGEPDGNIGLGFAIPINQAMVIGDLLIADGQGDLPGHRRNVCATWPAASS